MAAKTRGRVSLGCSLGGDSSGGGGPRGKRKGSEEKKFPTTSYLLTKEGDDAMDRPAPSGRACSDWPEGGNDPSAYRSKYRYLERGYGLHSYVSRGLVRSKRGCAAF